MKVHAIVESSNFVTKPQASIKTERESNKNISRCKCLSPTPCSCTLICCYGRKCSYKMNRLQLALVIFLVISLLLFCIVGIIPFDQASQPIRPLTTALPSAISKHHTRVLLYGDSQWGIVDRYHHLAAKLQAYLPDYPMNFTVVGDLGVKAHNLNERLHKYMYLKPHMVLINLDSDCSNVNENVLSIQERTIVRDHYRGNISAVVHAWLQTGAAVALGGPGLLGEGPLRPLNVQVSSQIPSLHSNANRYVRISHISHQTTTTL